MVDILIQLDSMQSVGFWMKPNNGTGVSSTQTLAKLWSNWLQHPRKQEGHLHVTMSGAEEKLDLNTSQNEQLQDSGWPTERVPPTNFFFFFTCCKILLMEKIRKEGNSQCDPTLSTILHEYATPEAAQQHMYVLLMAISLTWAAVYVHV